jgi:hypothetical protein
MADEPRKLYSHLFTVRVWQEDLGQGRLEWRGKVQHVMSGEGFYFREWQDLIVRLKSLLEKQEHLPIHDDNPSK